MSNEDVLEHSGQQEESSVDIADLLEIANSKVFDDQDGLIDGNKNFEQSHMVVLCKTLLELKAGG